MASIIIAAIAFAVAGSAASLGGHYVQRAIDGGDNADAMRSAAQAERVRHDKALEEYQKAYEKYQEDRERLQDWEDKRARDQSVASHDASETDKAFVQYGHLKEPRFSDFYVPSDRQKTGEKIYGALAGGATAVAAGFIVKRFA